MTAAEAKSKADIIMEQLVYEKIGAAVLRGEHYISIDEWDLTDNLYDRLKADGYRIEKESVEDRFPSIRW